jgi:hypothetical protein
VARFVASESGQERPMQCVRKDIRTGAHLHIGPGNRPGIKIKSGLPQSNSAVNGGKIVRKVSKPKQHCVVKNSREAKKLKA